jgi:peptide/nickel transport system permease protein
MWMYSLRRILYNIPIFLAIVFVMMAALRIQNPVYAYLGKSPTPEEIAAKEHEFGLDRPFLVQYAAFVADFVRMPYKVVAYQMAIRERDAAAARGEPPPPPSNTKVVRSWESNIPVVELIAKSVPPSLALTVPALVLTAALAIVIGLVSAFNRGRAIDRTLMVLSVLGMSISYLVYIIFGQYWGAYLPQQHGHNIFAVSVDAGAGNSWDFFLRPKNWVYYCLLPVIISTVVALGYDTRFYRAVMVEETSRDYIRTARAKGASERRVMFVHMLRNALIPIITRIMITLPFLITGALLLEYYFGIPGMGRTLINAVRAQDFPVIQTFVAILSLLFILSNILTDILYALVDPRVTLK